MEIEASLSLAQGRPALHIGIQSNLRVMRFLAWINNLPREEEAPDDIEHAQDSGCLCQANAFVDCFSAKNVLAPQNQALNLSLLPQCPGMRSFVAVRQRFIYKLLKTLSGGATGQILFLLPF